MTLLVLMASGMAVIGWSHISDGHHQSSLDEISEIKRELATYQATVTAQSIVVTTGLAEINATLKTQNESIIRFYQDYGEALNWARRQAEKDGVQ